MFEKLFEIFKKNNYGLYYVGGCVRDVLLSTIPKDYDFTTLAIPEKIKEILSSVEIKYYTVGEKFGTIAAEVDGQKIEITTYRKDITKGRKPEVAFSTSLQEDLERRDFTINSICSTADGNLIDPFDGQKDIKNKIIKAVKNPYNRFAEDPLRMLRAVRFASKLGFDIEENTLNAIKDYASSILSISRERWLEELNKLLLGDYIEKGLNYLVQSGLFNYIFLELLPILKDDETIPHKNLWKHILTVIRKSPKRLDVRWAAFLHDVAKPQTISYDGKDVHFLQHENLGAEMAGNIARRLKMGNDQKNSIVGLISLHHRISAVVSRKNNPPVSISALRRVIRECEEQGCDIMDLVDLFEADCSSGRYEILERQTAHANLLRTALREMKEEELRPKLPSGIGNVIMEKLNLAQGGEVGKIKQVLDKWLLDGILLPDMTAEKMIEKYLERKNK